MKYTLSNIYRLGIKELLTLCRDPMLLILILYTFTLSIYTSAVSEPDSLTNAAIAIVDEDHSQLSERITDSFYPPMFMLPKLVNFDEIDENMDNGRYTFVLVLPAKMQEDILAKRTPDIQLNIDATRMSQAFTGGSYIQQILDKEVRDFINKERGERVNEITLNVRNKFNMNLISMWHASIVHLIENITLLAIVLTGSALIREREHGTLEHLLVMPVNSFEIMVSKIWSMTLVVLCATALSIFLVVQYWLKIPLAGNVLVFFLGVILHLLAVTSMGIMLATIAQNMPQMGMLLILVLMPMNILSGGSTPIENMPIYIRKIMGFFPTTHFVELSQAVLFRGAELNIVWKPMLAIFLLSSAYFFFAFIRFRKTVAS